jgi:hypothetical protein
MDDLEVDACEKSSAAFMQTTSQNSEKPALT